MHIPKSAISLKDKPQAQLRLGLQGPPASGKTTSSLTFPNPIVADFDGGLTQFAGSDILHIPFYDPEFIEKIMDCKITDKAIFPNRKKALIKFLQLDALKFTQEQTLILDSWTAIQTAFDFQTNAEPKYTQQGKIDEYAFWAEKIEYSEKVMVYLCSLKCNVVVTLHESSIRDPHTGQLMEKLAPLMQGKFVAQLKRWFTDFFRMISEEKKNKEGKVDKIEYFWQIRSDNKFDAKTRLKNIPDGIFRCEPHYKIFEQYK